MFMLSSINPNIQTASFSTVFFYMYIPQIADRQHTVLSPLTHLHVNYFDRLILFQVLTSAMASFLFQGMERIIK